MSCICICPWCLCDHYASVASVAPVLPTALPASPSFASAFVSASALHPLASWGELRKPAQMQLSWPIAQLWIWVQNGQLRMQSRCRVQGVHPEGSAGRKPSGIGMPRKRINCTNCEHIWPKQFWLRYGLKSMSAPVPGPLSLSICLAATSLIRRVDWQPVSSCISLSLLSLFPIALFLFALTQAYNCWQKRVCVTPHLWQDISLSSSTGCNFSLSSGFSTPLASSHPISSRLISSHLTWTFIGDTYQFRAKKGFLLKFLIACSQCKVYTKVECFSGAALRPSE